MGEHRQGAQILLVDDDADQLSLCQRWLNAAGYQVRTATGGVAALASLERTRPDLVISDLVTDDMSGLQLLSEIHRHDPVLPTMVMSGRAGFRTRWRRPISGSPVSSRSRSTVPACSTPCAFRTDAG
jgi:DNA-binding NtrC family response regulator